MLFDLHAVDAAPDLRAFDFILVNSSAGKDSQAMTDYVVELARAAGVADRLVMVHADLGRVEWKGTRELAEEHAAHYGIRFEVVKRSQDLLSQVEARGMWPSSTARYCTSDHKRDQVAKLFTQLTNEAGKSHARILNCMGIRAQESPARAKRSAFVAIDKRASNGRRTVSQWLPIFGWSVDQVWERIAQAGTRAHEAYALGMPRLSCCFCIFAPKAALVLAGKHNPELLDAYVATEEKIKHSFRVGLTLREVKDATQTDCGPVTDWTM